MRPLTSDEVARFHDDGFVVVDGYFDSSEVVEWRSALSHGIEAQGDVLIPGRTPRQIDDGDDDPADTGRFMRRWRATFLQRLNVWKSSVELRRLVLDGRLGSAAAQLYDLDRVRLWQDQAVVKPPYGEPTSFHLDLPMWSFRDPRSLTVWIALNDVDRSSGCLYYVRRSHELELDEAVVPVDALLGDVFRACPDAVSDPVPAEVGAGGICIHSSRTIHGAAANMTTRTRWAYACSFMPDGAAFAGRQASLTDEYVATLRSGDALTDDEQNPLAFTRPR